MKLDIQARNVELTRALQGYIKRRLYFAFGSRDSKIKNVKIMLSDVNGPKGGCDKRCRILLRVAGLKDIIIEEFQSDSRSAVDRAASRARQTLGRRLMKWKNKHRQKIIMEDDLLAI